MDSSDATAGLPRAGAASSATAAASLRPLADLWSFVIFVPATHADAVRSALAGAGAGAVRNYDSCSFSSRGVGRFRPLAGARPAIGVVGTLEAVEEERVEVVVDGARLVAAVTAVKAAHPYEEPAMHLYLVVDYRDALAVAGVGAAVVGAEAREATAGAAGTAGEAGAPT